MPSTIPPFAAKSTILPTIPAPEGEPDGKLQALRSLHRRPDDVNFFTADVAAVAGVRVEAGDQDVRICDREFLFQVGVQADQYRLEVVAGNGCRYRGQWQMCGRQCDP